MKGACNAMFATFWQRLPHRDYDDLNPRPEHAEAVVQWQWLALWHMWEAAFGLALWHSGDSGVFFGEGKRHEPLSKKLIGRLVVLGLATSVADPARAIVREERLDLRPVSQTRSSVKRCTADPGSFQTRRA
jgi:hypothetical protein